MKNYLATIVCGLALFVPAALAQSLTPAQKAADFRYLASLYDTHYAPYEWKKQLFGFDALKIGPWLDRVSKTTTDLDFYELCVSYVASLNDTHDRFSVPSDFSAILPISIDIYDGKLLIEGIDRTVLPVKDFPFQIGDELVSFDGRDAMQVLTQDILKYTPEGNPLAARRLAASRFTSRQQTRFPHATDLGDSATVVIGSADGTSNTYMLPWAKTGTPIEVGPVPDPKTSVASRARKTRSADERGYMDLLDTLRWSGVDTTAEPDPLGLRGYGSRSPVFLAALATFNFTRRLGGASADFYYSGTFKRDDLTIGYIRIPNYAPPSQALALQQLDAEIAFMTANTDGLIVDEMRNTGGSLCFGENIAARLIPYQFHATGFQMRATYNLVSGLYNSVIAAKAANAPPAVIAQYEMLYNSVAAANAQSRGLTDPVPLCTSSLDRDPVKLPDGTLAVYQKPLMLLVDEFSTSTADSVAGMMQDAKRGLLFGMGTNGAGGTNTSFDAGPYSQGVTGMTLGLQVRKDYVGTLDYPTTKLIENVGVRPEITDDYMTKANLLQNGAPFVHDFLEAMSAWIRLNK